MKPLAPVKRRSSMRAHLVCFTALLFPVYAQQGLVVTTSAGGAPSGAQRSSGAQTSVEQFKPEELGTLEGVVRNSASGEGLGKAGLTLRRMGRGNERPPSVVLSAVDGKFRIAGVEPGEYQIHASRNGFVQMVYGARRPMSPGTTLKLQKAQVIKNIEIKLMPHSIVTGRVLDSDGDPVAYAMVQLLRPRFLEGRRQLMPMGSASTNDLGEFRIFGVPGGKYMLSASQMRTGMMPSPLTVPGPGGQGEEAPARTFYPGTLEGSQAGAINVPLGEMIQGVDVKLLRARTYRVRGKVAGAPAGGGNRTFVRLAPRSADRFYGAMESQSVQAARDGSFELRGVPPGSYYAHAFHVEPGPNGRLTGKAQVEVAENHVDDVQVTLQPGFVMTGSVRAEGAGEVKLNEVRVGLQDAEGMSGAGTVAKEDGSLTFGEVAEGKYTVNVFNMPEAYYVKSIRIGEADALNVATLVSPGSTITVVLTPGAATLSGVVTDDKGNPNTAATVVLIPARAPDRPPLPQLTKTVSPSQDGTYMIKGIPLGDYSVVAVEEFEYGAEQSPDFLKTHEKYVQKVAFREGATEARSLKASPEIDQ